MDRQCAVFLARDLGYHQNENLRLVELASTKQVMEALRLGKLDAAVLTLDEVLSLSQDQIPLSIIWVVGVSTGSDALLVRPEIISLADLRGRRIGVEQSGTGDYFSHRVLERAGLRPDEVQLIPLSAEEHPRAWQAQHLDALVTFDLFREQLLQQGAHVLFDSRELSPPIVDVLVVRQGSLACCRQSLGKLIEGQQRALQALSRTRDASLPHLLERYPLSPEQISATLANIHFLDAEENRDYLHAQTGSL